MNTGLGDYPDIQDSLFYTKLLNKKEFRDTQGFVNCYQPHQIFLSNFISPLTSYGSVLLYASTGTGKTLSSIAITENFKKDYKILVILKNDTLIENYKIELLNKCTDYGKRAAVDDIKKDINKDYHFITYYDIIKYRGSLSDTVVIVDEAHNITEIKAYKFLFELLKKSTNTKLVLMTATPVYDNVTEIFELNNLLNAKNIKHQLPTGLSNLLKSKMITKQASDSRLILNDTSSKLSKLGKDSLLITLRGKVSYVTKSSDDYATSTFVGTSIANGIRINISSMSEHQRNGYNPTITSGNNSLFKKSIDASEIVYPDGSISKPGYVKYIQNNTDKSFLKKENVNQYSCKLYSVLDNLQKAKGSCFIYSNLVNNGGVDLISECLIQNGYKPYRQRLTNVPSFIVLKGDIPSKKIQKLIELFNDERNKDGSIIKVIIGSPIVSEGITLKNIRQIHIFDSNWNMSKVDQIIGRGIRYKSHSELALIDRSVKVFLHCAVTDSKESSIDFLKYELSVKKDIAIKEVEYMLRMIAIDCKLSKQIPGKDFSRDCLYSECNYKCFGTIGAIDNSSYVLGVNDKELRDFIHSKIIKLFGAGDVFSLMYIIDYINRNKTEKIDASSVYIVLGEIVDSDDAVVIRSGKKYKVINIGDYFILQKIKNTIKTIPVIKKVKQLVKPKQKRIVHEINATTHGTIDSKNVFRLVHNTTPVLPGDLRSFTNGKECTFYSKQELKEIVGPGLTTKETKKSLCDEIYKYLKKNNLLVKIGG